MCIQLGVTTVARRGEKVKVKGPCEMCVLHEYEVYTAASHEYRLTAVVVGYRRDVTSSELGYSSARRAAWRGVPRRVGVG